MYCEFASAKYPPHKFGVGGILLREPSNVPRTLISLIQIQCNVLRATTDEIIIRVSEGEVLLVKAVTPLAHLLT